MITCYRLSIDSRESQTTLADLEKITHLGLSQIQSDIKEHLDSKLTIDVNIWTNNSERPVDIEIQIVHLFDCQELERQMHAIASILGNSYLKDASALHFDIDSVDYPQLKPNMFACSCEFVNNDNTVLRRHNLTKNMDYITYNNTVSYEEGYARNFINRINRNLQTYEFSPLYLPSRWKEIPSQQNSHADFNARHDALLGALVGATLRMNYRIMQWFALRLSAAGLDLNEKGELEDKSNLQEIERLHSILTESTKKMDALPPISPTSWFCNQNYYVLNGYLDIDQFHMLLNSCVGTMLLINTTAGVNYLCNPPYRTLLMQYSTSIAIVFLYEVYTNNPMNATHLDNSPQFTELVEGLGISDNDIIYVNAVVTTDEKHAIKNAINKIYPISETNLQEFLDSCNKGDTLPNITATYRKYIANKTHNLIQQRYNELSENSSKEQESELVMHYAALQNMNFYDPLSKTTAQTYDDTIMWKVRLRNLVGLRSVKQQIYNLEAKLTYRRLRGCNDENSHLVYTFEGNPGCGKTMVARLFAYILKQIGILTSPEDPFYEVQISQLVGVHLGEATKGVDEVFEKGKGRLIFIDEAYALLDEGQYGSSAINTIVKNISHMSADTILVLAGYPAEINKLLKKNAGLESRVSEHIKFEDYSCDELIDILKINLENRLNLRFGLPGLRDTPEDFQEQQDIIQGIKEFLQRVSSCDAKDTGRSLGNARAIDNLMEELEIAHAKHLKELDNTNATSINQSDELFTIRKSTVERLLVDLLERYRTNGTVLGSKFPPYFIATDDSDTFNNIIGNSEAKNQLMKQIESFKHSDSGRGVLLTGAPGCGKTSLARAFAHECGTAFLAVNASDLLNKYVGETREVTDSLFDAAAEYDKCTLFIDEIDAIGSSRGYNDNSTAQKEALYVLLTRLDGAHRNGKKLFIIAATNYPRSLDAALLRRLGIEIKVELPSMEDRLALLRMHLSDTPNTLLDAELQKFAGSMQNQSYDTIVQIVTNAKRKINLEGKKLTYDDLSLEADLELYGAHSNVQLSHDEKLRVAVHEIGHATISLKQGAPVESISISIKPRSNGALGFTKTIPDADTHLYTRAKFCQLITQLLGGRAAEDVFFGYANVSNGCSNDLERATDLATDMITHYGMGTFLRVRSEMDPEVCIETDRLLRDCYTEAKTTITCIKENILKCSEILIQKTELGGSELAELLKV